MDEGRFDRGFVGAELLDDARKPVMDGHQPLRQGQPVVGLDRAAGEIDQPVALAGDQAPAGAAEARIDAEDANRLAHGGLLIAPRTRMSPKSMRPLVSAKAGTQFLALDSRLRTNGRGGIVSAQILPGLP